MGTTLKKCLYKNYNKNQQKIKDELQFISKINPEAKRTKRG